MTLARQLLRQESVGSSRIENLIVGQRRLARAPAGSGKRVDDTADLVIGNVRAMERAIALAVEPRPLTRDDIVAIHRTLFEGTRDQPLGGIVRPGADLDRAIELQPRGRRLHPAAARARRGAARPARRRVGADGRASGRAGGVSETAATRALGALERAGVLTRPSQQKWGRRWEAPEVFELLDAFEHDVATPGDATRPARPVPRGGEASRAKR